MVFCPLVANFNLRILNSTQRASTDAGETPQCPYLNNLTYVDTIYHIFLTLIYLQLNINFSKFILIFIKMVVIVLRVRIVFAISSFGFHK